MKPGLLKSDRHIDDVGQAFTSETHGYITLMLSIIHSDLTTRSPLNANLQGSQFPASFSHRCYTAPYAARSESFRC